MALAIFMTLGCSKINRNNNNDDCDDDSGDYYPGGDYSDSHRPTSVGSGGGWMVGPASASGDAGVDEDAGNVDDNGDSGAGDDGDSGAGDNSDSGICSDCLPMECVLVCVSQDDYMLTLCLDPMDVDLAVAHEGVDVGECPEENPPEGDAGPGDEVNDGGPNTDGGAGDDADGSAGDDDLNCREGKVLICHVPPGNPENRHEICVGENAVRAHLNHGHADSDEDRDNVGPCPPISVQ